MANRNKLASLFAVICSLTLCGSSQVSNVDGTVKDAKGGPLGGVEVFAINHVWEQPGMKTDSHGHFQLKEAGRAILFVAPGYKPLTYIRGPQETSFEVSLAPGAKTRKRASCPSGHESGKRVGNRIGGKLLFLVPPGTEVRTDLAVDNVNLRVIFPQRPQEELVVWDDGLLATRFLPEEWLVEAREFSEKDGAGFDWAGKSRDGMNWRWLSSSRDLIYYENASDEAARFFDGIIDSACVGSAVQLRRFANN